MRLRLAGLLLFLPVPIVLVLFTQRPLGLRLSLAVGVAVMLTHRLYARPFALRHAAGRCLWCGGAPVDAAAPLRVGEPMGETEWRACAPHRDPLVRTLAWAAAHRRFLRVAIGGGLVVFLLGALLGSRVDDSVAFFRGAVAIAVLPLGWRGPRRALSPPDAPPGGVPFPVHIQALIGTAAVLWLFRIVGLVWLALAVWHLAPRLSGL